MTKVPRLDVLAMKTIKTLLKEEPDLPVQQTVKSILQNVQSVHHEGVISQKQSDLNFLLLRFIHLRLIVSLLSLLDHEPESLIELHFKRHSPIEITKPLYDDRRVYMIMDQDVFWNKNDFTRYLINLFFYHFPRSLTVYRGALSMRDASVHTFVHAVDDTFSTPPRQERKLHRLYNQHYLKHFA